MSEFLMLITPQEAITKLLKNLGDTHLSIKMTPTSESLDRIVAQEIRSLNSLPSFPRSAVDGYAVSASDTYGASESLPAYFTIIGEAKMGILNDFSLLPGQAVIIHTGGMLPKKSDSVIMIEDTQRVSRDEVEILKAIAPGDNMIGIGEDILEGQIVIAAGTRIRPVEIGITEIPLWSKPKVGIISSGDEIIDPHQEIKPGQVRDVNSYMLSALITQMGGEPIIYGTVHDRLDDLLPVAKTAHEECDLIVFTAGSSVSVRDITAKAIGFLGSPGVLVHGVKMKPGKPVILAVCSGKPVIGLPGNPVSAFVAANLFISRVISYLFNNSDCDIIPSIRAELSNNIASQAGREDWVPIKLESSKGGWRATPIFYKSNLIFSLVSADGLIHIPSECTGLDAGKPVDVILY
jgi:molybdopterin molybdotransferase